MDRFKPSRQSVVPDLGFQLFFIHQSLHFLPLLHYTELYLLLVPTNGGPFILLLELIPKALLGGFYCPFPLSDNHLSFHSYDSEFAGSGTPS